MNGPGENVDPNVVKLVRRRDPDTSWEAASRQTEGNRARLQRRIYARLLVDGPMTHEELHELLWFESPSGVRSRCSELVEAGWVVDSGERGRTATGGSSIMWRAVTDPADPAPVPEPREDDGWRRPTRAGRVAARARGAWEGVDDEVVDAIVRAYLNPKRDAAALADERGDS